MRLKDFFKVETLDFRLGSKTGGESLKSAQPSKWNTPEFYIYYLFFATIPALMLKSVYDVSKEDHPNYPRFERLLQPGWIPGRKVDNSDLQYRSFRNNIPYMAVVLIVHPLLRKLVDSFSTKGNLSKANGNANATARSDAADSRLKARINFDLFFATIFLIALHGVSAVKIFLIVWMNYRVATSLPKQYVRVATWVFNIGILFANELCRGYPLRLLADQISQPNVYDQEKGWQLNWGTKIDMYGGLIPRWEVLFNFTVLRLIAFNMDYVLMLDRRASSPIEKKNLDPASLSEQDRAVLGAQPKDFTFRNYISYVLYSPLYLAGPIINFNDFISQQRYTLPSINRSRIIPYAFRFLLCLLTMEVVLHYLYAVAISKSSPNWASYSPFELSMLGYFNLHIIWLKLLLPWRFFRLWALLDGIDAPENMVRCMSDNYSTVAFWRSWHRSFNLWITRYVYFPLGGSQVSRPRAVLNYLVVFTFVALWHDINLRLLAWAWLVVLFVLPQLFASYLFPAKKWADRPDAYRWICGVGAVGNILMMMAANLVGFAVGLDGLKGLVDGVVGSYDGRIFMIAACVTLFVGSQIMFEVRESEKRRGIDLKY